MALLFRSDLRFSVLPSPSGIESVWCKLHIDKLHIVVGVIYRPPDSSLDMFHTLNEFANAQNFGTKHLVLMGDFNAPGVDWPSLTHNGRDSHICGELINFSLSFGLTQIVTGYTRHNALLDLVFVSSNMVHNVCNCEIIDGISDHKAVLVSMQCTIAKRQFVVTSFHDFNRADDVSILDCLADKFDYFLALATRNDVDALVDFFEQLVKTCILQFVPIKTKKKNTSVPWMNRGILHLSRRVRRMRQARSRRSSYDDGRFFQAKEELRIKINAAKNHFFRVELPTLLSNNPRKFWSSILPRDAASASFSIDNETTNDPAEISEAFNRFFESVFTRDDLEVPLFYSASPFLSIPDIIISEEGVLNLILNLNTKKCKGPDDIPNAFLVRYSVWASKFLTVIFQKSLETGIVPSLWKLAKVIPLFKSGEKHIITNYRPISLTSYSCKLLEHIIYKHIVEHLEQHNLLSQFQHGFRRGFSTVTQLTEFVHDISSSLDSGEQVDAIFIDFSKAFDTVSHTKLICKLTAILNNPVLVKWIENFLSDRAQIVEFNGSVSNKSNVTSGVCQGSVLGPLLFLLYINDLPGNINSKIRFYADDCVLYDTISSPQCHQKLNESFSRFCAWCKTWQMTVNFCKTVSMSFTHKRSLSNFTYSSADINLQRVSEYKYLGIIFTSNLSWSKHIEYICTKSLKKLGYLRRTLSQAPKDTKLLMYKTLIRPTLDYACTVWNPYRKGEINKIEAVQKKAIRFICRRYDCTFSPTTALVSLELTTLAARREIESLTFFHRIIHCSYRLSSNKYITYANPTQTRSNHTLNVSPYHPRTDTFKYSFFPRAIERWNSLPGHVRSLDLRAFPSKIQLL